MRKYGSMVILILLLCICQFALQPVAAMGNPEQASVFKDVGTNHWGLKDITKMSARNIVRGYIDGSFKPDKSVTQMEALLMVVRNMDSGSLLSDIDTNQPLPVKVPKWAEEGCKTEILFSIQNGLIVPSENNFNASSPATRAWLTKLLVRMINKENEALSLTDQNPSATDAADIPTWARSYTSWALKNRLIKGYPDGTFKPNQAVTRAEMASLLSRSESFLDLGEKVVHGKLLSTSGETLYLTVNSQLKILKIADDVRIFDENGKVLSLSDLQANIAVTLIINESDVNFIEVLPSSYALDKLRGTIVKVLNDDGVIIFKDNSQKMYAGVVLAKAFISSQAGDVNSLSQITSGGQVEVGYNSDNQIVHVMLLNGKSDDTGFLIQELKPAENLLVVKSPSGQSRSFNLSKNVAIKIPGVRFPVIDDLQPGDKVLLNYSGNTVVGIELLKANQETSLSGTVVFISTEKNLLAIQKDDGSIETFTSEADVKVTVDGDTKAKLSDVSANDTVELNIQNNSVISITVKNKSTEKLIKGIIVSIDKDSEVITISNENTYELQSYRLGRNATIIVDGLTKTLSSLETGMKVDIELENNRIIYLELNNRLEGLIKSIDKKRNRITLSTGTNSKTYELDDDCDININGRSREDLDDLNIADFVELKTEDDKVTEINVREISDYQVVKVSRSSKEITVWDSDGSSKRLGLDNRTIIEITGVSNPDIEDILVGSNIAVTFMGDRISKISMVKLTRGKIEDVNSTSNTLSVQTFDGKTETFKFNDRCQVIKGSTRSDRITALSEGDRIEVTQTGSSVYVFTVMTKDSGTYQSLNSDNSKITISKSSSATMSRYLASDLYINKGTRSKQLSDLTTGTQIDLYSLNDIVFEIEIK